MFVSTRFCYRLECPSFELIGAFFTGRSAIQKLDKDNAKKSPFPKESYYNDRRTGIDRFLYCPFFSFIYGILSKNWQYRVYKLREFQHLCFMYNKRMSVNNRF